MEKVTAFRICSLGTQPINPEQVKAEDMCFGFLSCGVSKAEFLEEEAPANEREIPKKGAERHLFQHLDLILFKFLKPEPKNFGI